MSEQQEAGRGRFEELWQEWLTEHGSIKEIGFDLELAYNLAGMFYMDGARDGMETSAAILRRGIAKIDETQEIK